jgi:hypothetical protein
MKRTHRYGAIVIVVIVAAGVVSAVLMMRGPNAADGGATADQNRDDLAEELQRRLGADSCTNSGFSVENQADGSRLIIYDCAFGARRRCITVERGLARDATADVKPLFKNATGGTRPACAGT